MILALDGTAITVAFITTIGLIIAGLFGYLGIRSQVQAASGHVVDKVAELDTLNSFQHGENGKILGKMLDTISEHGVLVSAVVNIQDRPIIKTDTDGSVIQVNAAAVKLLGMSAAELKGDGWVKAIHPGDRRRVFSAWADSIKDKSPFGPVAYRYIHPATGIITLVEACATPVISGIDDDVLSWVAVVVPITELDAKAG